MKIVNLIFILFCLNGCTFGQNKTNIQRCFLQKSKLELSKDFYGKHILLKGDIRVDSINVFINITDDRELFQKYSFEDKISILTEYLTFVGDTTTSNKFYKFRPSVGGQITRGLEVQIEALFSFSMMLINGYPSIRPILYYKHTKEKVILNEKLVQEIYDFYEEWLVTSKETDFKEITWPLAKTPYMWDGEKENIESYLIESLK